MNRSPYMNIAALLRRPGRLALGLLGVVLLLLGGVHLVERLLAHLTLWSVTVPVPGLSYLVLCALGAAALALGFRRGRGAEGQDR